MKKSEIRKLDKLWSAKIREPGVCAYCGKGKPEVRLNAHHIYDRKIRALRWELDNGICLCVSHHKFGQEFSAHATPLPFIDWLLGQYHLLELEVKH